MKQIRNFILLVDNHKPLELCRNTKGRYRVGAKTPDEAIEILRNVIGFGDIQVYYECKQNCSPILKYREVIKEIRKIQNGKVIFEYEKPRHATDPIYT